MTPEQEIESMECSVPRAVRTYFQAEDTARMGYVVKQRSWNHDKAVWERGTLSNRATITEIEIERGIYVNSICYKILGTVTYSCPFSNSLLS